MAFMKKSTRQAIAKYWGYMLLPVLYYGWFVGDIGYGPLAIASTLASAFFFLQVKAPCCAENREVKAKSGDPTFCRNNAKGILRGCRRGARWQNAKMIGHRSLWGRQIQPVEAFDSTSSVNNSEGFFQL